MRRIAFFQVTSSLILTVQIGVTNCGFGAGSATATTPMCVFRSHVSVVVEDELCVDRPLCKFSLSVLLHRTEQI